MDEPEKIVKGSPKKKREQNEAGESQIEILPDLILINVLTNCRAIDLLRMQLVSSRFRELIATAFRYLVHLNCEEITFNIERAGWQRHIPLFEKLLLNCGPKLRNLTLTMPTMRSILNHEPFIVEFAQKCPNLERIKILQNWPHNALPIYVLAEHLPNCQLKYVELSAQDRPNARNARRLEYEKLLFVNSKNLTHVKFDADVKLNWLCEELAERSVNNTIKIKILQFEMSAHKYRAGLIMELSDLLAIVGFCRATLKLVDVRACSNHRPFPNDIGGNYIAAIGQAIDPEKTNLRAVWEPTKTDELFRHASEYVQEVHYPSSLEPSQLAKINKSVILPNLKVISNLTGNIVTRFEAPCLQKITLTLQTGSAIKILKKFGNQLTHVKLICLQTRLTSFIKIFVSELHQTVDLDLTVASAKVSEIRKLTQMNRLKNATITICEMKKKEITALQEFSREFNRNKVRPWMSIKEFIC